MNRRSSIEAATNMYSVVMRRGVCPRSVACVLLVTLCMARSSHARETGASSELNQLLSDGIALRRVGKDAEALALFLRANGLDPESARVQAQLGTTYQALGRWIAADTHLTEALSHAGDEYIERHRAAIERAHEIVKDHLGSLAVEGVPAGADVSLNGRVIGSLPMARPERVAVGSYLLEVSLARHYTESRPISIKPRVLTRETVDLVPHSPKRATVAVAGAAVAGARRAEEAVLPGAVSSEVVSSDAVVPIDSDGGAPAWLPWTFGGASAATAAVGVFSWVKAREHAERWNDNSRCRNRLGVTRETLCGDERESARRYQTIAITGGIASGLFAVAAIWAGIAEAPDDGPVGSAGVGLSHCTWRGDGMVCHGAF
jgi:tetratricopeptide (TPR) repeat protein